MSEKSSGPASSSAHQPRSALASAGTSSWRQTTESSESERVTDQNGPRLAQSGTGASGRSAPPRTGRRARTASRPRDGTAAAGYADRRDPHRHRLGRPHAVREARRRPQAPLRDRARRDRDSRRRSSASVSKRREIEYVIMGQVLQAGAGQAPARQAAIGAGLPIEVPADTINKVCASSIRAIEIADSMIRAGDVEVVVTGGMESMSNAPYALPKARFGYKMGDGALVDLMIWDGLRSTFDEQHMVQQASRVARELGITREEQDAWAFRSQRARCEGAGRRRLRRRDRAGGGGRRGREHPPRHDARAARRAEAGDGSRGDDHRRQRAGRERRRVVRRRVLGGVRQAPRPRAARDDRRAGLRRRRVRVARAHARGRERAGSRARPASRSATWSGSR